MRGGFALPAAVPGSRIDIRYYGVADAYGRLSFLLPFPFLLGLAVASANLPPSLALLARGKILGWGLNPFGVHQHMCDRFFMSDPKG